MSSIHSVNVGGNSFGVTDSSNVAPIELTNFATRTYAKDRCFIMVDGLLYRAMVEIQSGDPIVVNGNAKRTTLDEIMAVMETDSDLIAPTEDGTTASTDYVIGKQIVRSGILYKVIAEIAEGDAFVIGNNIEIAGTLTSQIQALTNETSDIVNVLGSKNLFDNTMATQVVSGVTYTVNSDKSITANGTATEGASNFVGTFNFKAGVTYVLSGCPSGGSISTYLLSIEGVGYDSGNGYEYTPSSDVTKNIMLTIFNGVTADNLVFKPMICTKSVYEADNTYVPYAMTNRELTEVAQTLDSTTWSTTSAINGINVAYRKKNGIIFVRRNTSAATYTANTLVTIGELPQGFRPSFTIQAVIQNDTAVVTIIISADGTVKILSTTGNGIPAFCLSFPL